MAGEHVDELLVKLGLDTDAKGFKEANSQFTNLRTTALITGGAIAGAMAGAFKMSDGIAKSADNLGKWAASMDANIQKAQQWKHALAQAGSANPESEMMGMYENMERLRTQAQRGQIDEWALIESGMSLYSLGSMSNEEGLEYLMKGISDLSRDPERQRRALAALNFSSPAQHGVMTNYDATLAQFQRSDELGNADPELYENAAAYTAALTELTKSTDNLKDVIAGQLLPHMTEWIKAATGFVVDNKGGAERAVEIIAGPGTPIEKAQSLVGDEEVRQSAASTGGAYLKWINTATGWHPANIMLNKLLGGGEADTESEQDRPAASGALIREQDGRVTSSTPDTPQTKAYQAVTEEVKTRQADLPQPELTPETEAHRQATEEVEARQVEFEDAAQAPTPQTEAYQAVTEERALRSIKAASTGLSSEEMNYEPSASELIPQGNQSELIEGNRRLLPSYLPKHFQASSGVPEFNGNSRPDQAKGPVMNISVDARGSFDPAAIEAAANRGVRSAVREEIARDVAAGMGDFQDNIV